MRSDLAHDLYEDDFFAWTQSQAKELRRFARTRPNVPLDLAHIAEEIADLGKEQRNAVRSWVRRIIEHLLLLQYSEAKDPRRHWEREIRAFRQDIEDRLTRTLRADLRRQLPHLYQRVRHDLVADLAGHGEADAAARIPEHCPYTLDQILGEWFPEQRDEGRGHHESRA
ncbi:MAG TPA: DUF29 domain-containing protein [Geminicoccaceae bacterium]|nr:DUF29 domain-containing protein [Geminicoccaceae bacterium]